MVQPRSIITISDNSGARVARVVKVLGGTRKRYGRLGVERVNFIKRHTKPRSQKIQGGILEREAPIHVSNVMHLCPKCQMGVRVTMKRGQDGKRERYCARCGEAIPRVR